MKIAALSLILAFILLGCAQQQNVADLEKRVDWLEQRVLVLEEDVLETNAAIGHNFAEDRIERSFIFGILQDAELVEW